MADLHGRVVAAATDGACSGNPGPGGWGALLRFEDGAVEELGGHEQATTNNRMELQAALSLLRRLKECSRDPSLKIRTDSKYLINGFEKWIMGWKRNEWRTSAGKSVLNKDLWVALDKARLTDVSFMHVKGHSGDPDNDRVDKIAVAFSKGLFPALQSVEKAVTLNTEIEDEKSHFEDSSPLHLQQLYSRLELLDGFARGGYALTSVELGQLINHPLVQLEKRIEPFKWREWQFRPESNHVWRVWRNTEDLGDFKEDLND